MQDAALDLGGASGRVGAEPAGFAFGLYERRTAVGTYLGELRLLGSGFALGLFHARDLGDDFSAFLHVHPVSFVDVQGTDLVFVHQRGTLYHGAAQEDGLQVGDGGDGAGSAHLVVDGEDGGAGLLCLELIRHGPAGAFGSVAQLALDGHFVDLDDNAVGGIGEVFAGRVPMADKGLDLFDAPGNLPVLAHGKAPTGGGLQGVVVGGIVYLPGGNVVEGAEKASPGYFCGVLQFERAAGRVTGIREKGLFLHFFLMVEAVEGLVGHEDFSSYFELLRPAGAVEFMGDIGNVAGIDGDVVSLHAVSPGEGAEKHAVLVGKADGGSVKLEFAAVSEGGVNGFGGSVGKFFHFLDAVGVAKGEHGVFVGVLGKAFCSGFLEVRAHAAGGGVGRGKLRELGFQGLQLVHELVVLIVAHGGSIFYVILAAVLPKNGPELFYPAFCLCVIHVHYSRARICVHRIQRYKKNGERKNVGALPLSRRGFGPLGGFRLFGLPWRLTRLLSAC